MTGDAMKPTLPQRKMKSRMLWSLGVVVAALLFAGGSSQEASSEVTNNPVGLQPEANVPVAPAMANPEAAPAGQTGEADLAEAAVKPILTERPLPPSVKPAGPLSEVIKLADSGVDEAVMMAFVTNSTSPFNLGVEEIVYLNDIGVAGSVVTAMMQRDQALKESPANAAPGPAGPGFGAPTSQFASEPGTPGQYAPQPPESPAPQEMAPEPGPPADYANENYAPPPAADAGYSTFYGSLAPYGTWVDVAGYGPCWQPTVVIVNPAWRPYCNGGRWVYTEWGWYWLSATPNPSPQLAGSISASQPNRIRRFGGRPERPATGTHAAPTTTIGSAPTLARRTTDPAPRPAAPLILHGPTSSWVTAGGSSVSAGDETFPPNSLIVRGRNSSSHWQTAGQSSPPATEALQAPLTVQRQDTLSRPAMTQRSRSFMTAEVEAPSQPRWSIPRKPEAPVRTEPWRHDPAHNHSAPAEVRWTTPAPAFAPQPTRSYSPPTAAPTPREQAMESRSSYSAPSASAVPAPAAHGHSSSDRNGR